VTRSRSCVCQVHRKRPKSASANAGYSDEKGFCSSTEVMENA
jgi:hypothetical protein